MGVQTKEEEREVAEDYRLFLSLKQCNKKEKMKEERGRRKGGREEGRREAERGRA